MYTSRPRREKWGDSRGFILAHLADLVRRAAIARVNETGSATERVSLSYYPTDWSFFGSIVIALVTGVGAIPLHPSGGSSGQRGAVILPSRT